MFNNPPPTVLISESLHLQRAKALSRIKLATQRQREPVFTALCFFFFDYSSGLLSWELRSDPAGCCRGPYTGKHQVSSACVLSDGHLGIPQMGSLRC